MLGRADGGVWVGELQRLECYDTRRLQARGLARRVRRIRDGALAEPLPDLVWEESLLHALGQVRGIGNRSQTLAVPDGALGGIRAPLLVLEESTGLRPR